MFKAAYTIGVQFLATDYDYESFGIEDCEITQNDKSWIDGFLGYLVTELNPISPPPHPKYSAPPTKRQMNKRRHQRSQCSGQHIALFGGEV
jgi:hypothetical protein